MRDWRFYDDFAEWWPLVSPVDDYAEEAAAVRALFEQRAPSARTMLELGCGGGHNAHFLKERFDMTLTDLSAAMLALSEKLNPECRHIAGDMRTLRLDDTFDTVFVHDAIDYMLSENDLAKTFATAAAHLEPGGVAMFIPDDLRENFAPGTLHDGSDGDDGRGVRLLEWTWDPDPDDTEVCTEYAFVFRHPDGTVTTTHETHRTGLFDATTWMRLMAEAGFSPEAVPEPEPEDRKARTFFIGTKR